MKRSDAINEISSALAKAQAEMKNPGFDSTNPHFRNKFASLASVRNAVIPVLAKHCISLTQELTNTESGVNCLTIISHASGQWMEFGPLVMPVGKNDAQGFGSASTYCKRYSLMAVCGVVGDEDDDAEAAQGRTGINPRGDMGLTITPAQRDPIVAEFRAALDLDAEEHQIASAVYAIHDRIRMNPDLYVAVSDVMTSKERSALKAFVKMAKETK